MRLMMVSPGRGAASVVAAQARLAARAGIDLFQLREKTLTAHALLELAREVQRALSGSVTHLIVNGRADVAVLAGAVGVHLPADGLSAHDVRRAFPGLRIGVSTHDLEEARRAAAEGADYLVYGPVFATPGKEARATGATALADVVRAVAVPVLAIGGVTEENAALVRRAGARGVAAIRELQGDDLTSRVAALRRAWDAS
jgi:thiamine-phosphate pyrophosphorylase